MIRRNLHVYSAGDIPTWRGTTPGDLKTQNSDCNPWSGTPGNYTVGVVRGLFSGRMLCGYCGIKRVSVSVLLETRIIRLGV